MPFLVGVPQKANPEPGCHYEVCDRSHGPPCPLWAAVTDHRRGDDVSTGGPKQYADRKNQDGYHSGSLYLAATMPNRKEPQCHVAAALCASVQSGMIAEGRHPDGSYLKLTPNKTLDFLGQEKKI